MFPVVFLLLVFFLGFLSFVFVAALHASGASGDSAGARAVACAGAGACGVVLGLGIMRFCVQPMCFSNAVLLYESPGENHVEGSPPVSNYQFRAFI